MPTFVGLNLSIYFPMIVNPGPRKTKGTCQKNHFLEDVNQKMWNYFFRADKEIVDLGSIREVLMFKNTVCFYL